MRILKRHLGNLTSRRERTSGGPIPDETFRVLAIHAGLTHSDVLERQRRITVDEYHRMIEAGTSR